MKSTLIAILLCCCLSVPAWAILWSDPVLLSELNDSISGYNAGAPSLSSDGMTMYFHRRGSDGIVHLWEAYRDTPTGSFTSQRDITELFNDRTLYTPWVSGDRLRLYYAEHENDVTKTVIHMASRSSVSSLWSDTMSFTSIHSDLYYDWCPTLSQDELTMYYATGHPSSVYSIYKATRTSVNSQFTNPVLVSEINDGSYAYTPFLANGDLTIFYSAIRDGYETLDLYMASRNAVGDPFGNIERLNINSDSVNDAYPFVTQDLSTLYFTTTEGIWMSQAVPEPMTAVLLAVGGLYLRRKR